MVARMLAPSAGPPSIIVTRRLSAGSEAGTGIVTRTSSATVSGRPGSVTRASSESVSWAPGDDPPLPGRRPRMGRATTVTFSATSAPSSSAFLMCSGTGLVDSSSAGLSASPLRVNLRVRRSSSIAS